MLDGLGRAAWVPPQKIFLYGSLGSRLGARLKVILLPIQIKYLCLDTKLKGYPLTFHTVDGPGPLRTDPGLGSSLGNRLDIKLGARLKIILSHHTP
jgi:hypothetical protein